MSPSPSHAGMLTGLILGCSYAGNHIWPVMGAMAMSYPEDTTAQHHLSTLPSTDASSWEKERAMHRMAKHAFINVWDSL